MIAKPLVKFPVSKNGDIGVPLGLLYLASYIRERNPTADVSFKPYRVEHQLGKRRDLVADFGGVDVVASGGSTTEMPDMLEMFRVAKKLGKKTVAGGIYPTNNQEDLLNSGLVDFIVRGEGEETFSELISALETSRDIASVKGISYLEDGRVVRTGRRKAIDLNNLVLPAYDLAPMTDYAKFATGSIYSARGCNMSCNFCTVSKHWKNEYRPRSVESVLEEIRILRDYGFERIHLKDESMLQDKERAVRLFTAIKDANIGVKIKGKARLDELDDSLLYLMKGAGVDMLHIGVESVSDRSLESMNKGLTIQDIRGTLDNVLSYDIGVNPVFMFSWIGETPDDLRKNAEFIQDFGSNSNVVTYISFLTPHPGTWLWKKSPDNGLIIVSNDINRYTHKQPVAVPTSMGDNGLELMVDTYHEVTREINMERVNPHISPVYMEDLREEVAA